MFFEAPPEAIPDDLNAEEYLELGKWYHEHRDIDLAREALQRAVSASPESSVARQATYFMAQHVPSRPIPKPVWERYEKASWRLVLEPDQQAEECRAILADCPDFDWVHSILGTALIAQKKPQEAIQSLQCALNFNPHREQPLLALVEAYIIIMDYDSAQLYLDKLGLILAEQRQSLPDDREQSPNAERFRQLSRSLQILVAID